MKKLFSLLYIFLFLFLIWKDLTFANIDVTVSPIRYEITLEKSSSTTKTIKLFNNTNSTHEIYVTVKNAIWMDDTGQPKFVENISNPYYHLASWIYPSKTSFTIWPNSSLDVPFSIITPNKAPPWWHYWAIFFNVKESSWWQINIQKRIWVLILLKVPWVVNAEWEITNISIKVRSGWGWWKWPRSSNDNMIWWLYKKYILWEKDEDLSSAPENTDMTWSWDTDFSVDLTLDFSNKWNTHLKPKWRVEIVDEDWKTLKKIWKETIKNEAWAIVWEKVVDYIPINDEDWNVLPNENRKFKQSWDWFAYETLDENWKKIIKYYDPSEYYSAKNKANKWYLMPREKVYTKDTKKKLTAKIKLEYTDPNWKEVEFNSAKEFYVNYMEDYVWLNRLVVIPWGLIILIIIIFFIISIRKKRKCPECKKTVRKDMHICPYCWEHLKKKKDKN